MDSREWARNRGVSDVISFVLVFGLITSAAGIVYVSGFTGLEDARDAERLENAERAFDVLGDNMADIYQRDAPARKTELKLADSQLTFGPATTFTVTVEDITDGSGNLLFFESNTRPLVFSLTDGSDTSIVYEGGAVIRTERDGAVLLRQPPLLISEDRTVVNFVAVNRGEGASALSGDSTILVRGVRQGRNVLVQDEDSDVRVTLTVETTSNRAPIWAEYINERADWSNSDWVDNDNVPCAVSDPTAGDGRKTVTCTVEPDEFYLTSTGIETTITN